MKLKILQTGDPVLRQKARELSISEIHSSSTQQLIELMRETMRDAPGVGLAAPQIGVSLQLVVIEDRPEYHHGLSEEQLKERERVPVPFHVLINPTITFNKAQSTEFFEGCLSVASFIGLVPRATAVKVEYLNEQAQPVTIHASGWYARILQHEIDHLNGILCIDHMNIKTFSTYENYNKFWKK
jgi:peptide deformylase